jgi:riboflavin biosynthesis pyrimidine reductase
MIEATGKGRSVLTDDATPLQPLYEQVGLPVAGLPDELTRLYGGPLGFEPERVVANFVQTVDGVIALPGVPRSNRVISGDSASDRFVMGLLRSFADAVLIGSGTLAGSPRGSWTPRGAYEPAADAYAELRSRLGLAPEPLLAVLTASGSVDPEHPALQQDAIVLTTDQGGERLAGRSCAEVVSLGPEAHPGPRAALALLRERGNRFVLSEAGPHLFGSLLAENLVDELFLTVSPLLAGRTSLEGRLGLIEERPLLPEQAEQMRLLSVRRDGAHLFLRYALSR